MERDLRSEYNGRLFYGKDAFEGLHTMDRLMAITRAGRDGRPPLGDAAADADFGRVPEGREGARPRAARAVAPVADPSAALGRRRRGPPDPGPLGGRRQCRLHPTFRR